MFETTSKVAQEDKPMSSNIPVDFISAGDKPSKSILASYPIENMNVGDDTSTISEFDKVEIVGGKADSSVNESITVPARLKNLFGNNPHQDSNSHFNLVACVLSMTGTQDSQLQLPCS